MTKSLKKKCTMLIVTAMLILAMSLQAFAATGYVKSMTVSKTSVSVKAGSSTKVTSKVTIYKTASKYVTAKSSSTAVATVSVGKPSAKGVSTITIKGVKKGTAYITVTTKSKNKSKKAISKKIKVTVNYADVTSLKATASATTLTVGKTAKITATVAPAKAYKAVSYSSGNTAVATVSSAGTIKAVSAGTAVITVKTKGKTKAGSYLTKKITITVKAASVTPTPAADDSFTASDYSVTYGSITRYIEFEINSDTATADELKAQGYTVNGTTASMNVTSPTATYTFKKLPKTLDEVKKIALNDEYGFAPMAAAIVALAGQETASTRFNVTSSEIYKSMDYLNSSKFSIYQGAYAVTDSIPSMFANRYCYFDGATPANAYTPNTPYTFTLELGPYYIPARTNDIVYGSTPARYMIMISFAGDDSQRYCDVWKSSDGNWYLWDDTWQHLVAGVTPAATQW